jgi:hypothetical protein
MTTEIIAHKWKEEMKVKDLNHVTKKEERYKKIKITAITQATRL